MWEYGADSVICYDRDDVVFNLQKIANKDGLYDVIFDSVSSDDPRYN